MFILTEEYSILFGDTIIIASGITPS